MATLTNTSATYITLNDEGRNTLVKKAYLTTRVQGTYIVLNWSDSENTNRKFSKTYLYTDVSSPSEASASALKTKIDSWIQNAVGTSTAPYVFDDLSFTKNNSTSVTINDSFVGEPLVMNGLPLKLGVGYTRAGSNLTLSYPIVSDDDFHIKGNKVI